MQSWCTRSIRANRLVLALTLGLMLSGCSMTQLRDRTVDIGGSVGSIYTRQVLENLASLAVDNNTMPSHFVFSKGTIHTSDSVTPGVTIPLGNQVTRTVAVGGVTQIVGSYNGLTLQGTEALDQTWEITPEKNAPALRLLRAVYLYVLGQRTYLLDLEKEAPAHPGQSHTLIEHISEVCKTPLTCFQVKQDQACAPPPPSDTNLEWVCLGKYRSAIDALTPQRQMVIHKKAYDEGVLFDLVLLSLQAQTEADLEAKAEAAAKTKDAEATAEEKAKNKVKKEEKEEEEERATHKVHVMLKR